MAQKSPPGHARHLRGFYHYVRRQPILHTLVEQVRAPKDETPRRQVPLCPGFGNEQNHRRQVYRLFDKKCLNP
jgi:hypothetical protein